MTSDYDINISVLTSIKLGVFLLRQLKDGIVHSGVPSASFRKHPWWVCPEMTNRGDNQVSNLKNDRRMKTEIIQYCKIKYSRLYWKIQHIPFYL